MTKVQAAPAAKAATTLGQERPGAAGAAKIRESCGDPSNSEDIGMPPGGYRLLLPSSALAPTSTRQKAARFLVETFSATGCCDRPGTSKWKKELTKGFTPARRARVAATAGALREAMTLEELRKAREISQEDVAETLDAGQPAVAKLEKRADMHVSNLRRYIEALGGTLEITARFPDASVVINNVGEATP
jgi:DNA-binding XRE family transcriptional regulator